MRIDQSGVSVIIRHRAPHAYPKQLLKEWRQAVGDFRHHESAPGATVTKFKPAARRHGFRVSDFRRVTQRQGAAQTATVARLAETGLGWKGVFGEGDQSHSF